MATIETIASPDGSNLLSTFYLIAIFNAVRSPSADEPENFKIVRGTNTFRISASIPDEFSGGDAVTVSVITHGTDFTYKHGLPTGGTATSLTLLLAGEPDTTLTNFSLSMKTLFDTLSAPFSDAGMLEDFYQTVPERFSIFGRISLFGNSGDDTGLTGNFSDILRGSAGDDHLFGFGGRDTLLGSIGSDTLEGGFGKDSMTGDSGSDSLIGGADNDFITGNADGDDANGGTGNDTLFGQADNDTLSGSFGRDLLIGGPGDDSLDGGSSFDTAAYSNAPMGVTVDLSLSSSQNTGGAGTDTLRDIENLVGSAFTDTLTGNDADNALSGNDSADILSGAFGKDTLLGGAGDDTIYGGTQADRIEGGLGTDSYYGGGGLDLFVFASADAAANDFINDFKQGEDRIDLSAIDANTTVPTDQKFHFIADSPFSGAVRELRYFFTGGNTVIEGDINHDATADFQLTIVGMVVLKDSDFIL